MVDQENKKSNLHPMGTNNYQELKLCLGAKHKSLSSLKRHTLKGMGSANGSLFRKITITGALIFQKSFSLSIPKIEIL